MSFVQKLADVKTDVINFVSFKNDDGQDMYVYIKIPKNKLPEFERKVKAGIYMDFRGEGAVIAYGEGKERNPEQEKLITDFIKEAEALSSE